MTFYTLKGPFGPNKLPVDEMVIHWAQERTNDSNSLIS